MNATRSQLNDLEREILHEVPEEGPLKEHAYVVWQNPTTGDIAMGPVRLRRTTPQGTFWSCSPFPGAWNDLVREEHILRVSHPQALIADDTARAVVLAKAQYAHQARHQCWAAPETCPELPTTITVQMAQV